MRLVVHIDFSIFVGDAKGFGRVHGNLELPAVPTMNAVISLLFPITPDVTYRPIAGFSGELQIERLVLVPGSDQQPILEISDVYLETMDDARQLADYLSAGFGLYVDEIPDRD